jgi:hypothetical protein
VFDLLFTYTKVQVLNFLERASYGKSKLVLLGTSSPCSKNPARDFCYRDRFVCVSVCVSVLVANGSLDLVARAARLRAFLFDKATIDAATEFTVQR